MHSNEMPQGYDRFSRRTAHSTGLPQMSLCTILGLWALVTVPMALLSLGLAPALIEQRPDTNPALLFWITIILGMAWQTVVSLGVLLAEGQRWNRQALQRRLWLRAPRDPVTGRSLLHRLYLIVLVGTVFVFATDPAFAWLDRAVAQLLPDWMTPAYGDISLLATPQNTGNWGLLGLALISSLFNYVLGEAFLFHGIFLPRMEGVFGRWAWVANAVLFGAYHVHKAAQFPTVVISCLAYSLPAQFTRSLWPALLIHGLEGVVLIGAVLCCAVLCCAVLCCLSCWAGRNRVFGLRALLLGEWRAGDYIAFTPLNTADFTVHLPRVDFGVCYVICETGSIGRCGLGRGPRRMGCALFQYRRRL